METEKSRKESIMREFFGFGGYVREVEGYMSWQHLVFVSSLMIIMVALAILFGIKNKNADIKTKNRVLIVSAILIDALELLKIVLGCLKSGDPLGWLYDLPLFLCSIQLITIPVAAFAKGRLKEVCLDFVFIFGILGAILGTYAAGNNYSSYPVLCFDNVVSGLTHSISGFCSLYIAISGMVSMRRRNIPFCFGILSFFCVAAYVANVVLDYNYMFLVRGDGTPYDIIFNLVGGDPIIYPISVVLLFFLYITAFYLVFYYAGGKKREARLALLTN